MWLFSLSLPALRSRSGRSIINGNWAIDRPGKYEGGGTMFTYRRPNEISSTAGESFLAEGPTNEILDVYVSNKSSPIELLHSFFLFILTSLTWETEVCHFMITFQSTYCILEAHSWIICWRRVLIFECHLLCLRWSSSSQIPVFTMSTYSHLRNHSAPRKKVN